MSMNMMSKMLNRNIDLNKVREELDTFVANRGSVQLVSNGSNGNIISYAPYIQHEGNHYIFISEIADHHQNLTENNETNLLFIQDEKDAANIAARVRVNFFATVEFVQKDETVMDKFVEVHGSVFKVIRNINDFHLIKLNLGKGSFVKGFGEAFSIAEDGSLTHKRGKGEKGHKGMPMKMAKAYIKGMVK